jgi:hypothetical protein
MRPSACTELTRLSIRLALSTSKRDCSFESSTTSLARSIENASVKVAAAELSEHQRYCVKCLGRWVEYVDEDLLSA